MASILLIDDDDLVLTAMRSMLEFGGHKVCSVSSGPAAMKSLQQDPPDVIVTDLLMPEMDGIDIIRAIRAIDQATPIIAVTGDVQMTRRSDHFSSAKTAGATETLMKPFRASVLCNLVGDVLRRRAKSDEAPPGETEPSA